MKTRTASVFRSIMVGVAAAFALTPAPSHAQTKKKNPASKLYVSDVAGEAQIDTGDSIEDLNKRSVYTAQGVVIDTKKPSREEERGKCFSTMVYSNGTGAFFDADTRVEIRRFVQEPFLPTRSDIEMEPSISQTHAFVSRGTVGLCTSKLVAGSTMIYTTPHASVNVRGRMIVIQTEADVTKISMLEGESTFRAGAMDMGGHTVHAGEQAVIRQGAPGQPNTIEIVKITSAELSTLDEKVAMAWMAKRTVYFDVRGRQQANGESGVDTTNGEIDTFNMQTQSARIAGGPFTSANGEIIAVPLVPTSLPVQFTVSPAALITPAGKVVVPPGTPKPGG